MTEIAIRQPATAAIAERDVIDGWITVVRDVGQLADYISTTDFVPKTLRGKPAAIAACILTGRELGIGPMQSLKSIHMVQGTPGLSAEYKRARALAAGHQITYDETTTARCIVRGRRKGTEEWVTVTWSMEDARRAKLAGKDVWQQSPRRMLEARATGELCDLLFPDCTLGLATTEVLEDGDGGEGAVSEGAPAANGAAPAASKPRTARRRQAVPGTVSDGSGEAEPEKPAAARTGRAEPPQPPLPGEDDERPADGAPDDTDYDTHGTATRGQLTAIWTVLSTVYGFTSDEKPQARKVCEHIIERQLIGGTTGNLSHNEAQTVLDTLAAMQTVAEGNEVSPREQLIVLLAGSEADGA